MGTYRSSAAKRPKVSGRKYGGRLQGPKPEKGPSRAQVAAEDALTSILEMFDSGELPEKIAMTVTARLEGTSPMVNWSLGNQLLALRAGTTDARGFRQWEQVGRHVSKGSRAFFILAPRTRKVTETDAATGEETSRPIVTGFTGIPVFRFEDTEGMPIERERFDPPALPPLYDVAGALGVSVEYVPNVGSYYGLYDPQRERIMLASHAERTFFHELAHAAHRRVLKERGKDLNGGQDAGQEIVAETVAATLCKLYGLDGYIWHGAEYVRSYAKDGNPAKAAVKVLSGIQACLLLIVETALETGAHIPA